MAQEGTVHVLALFIEPTRKEAGCIRYDLVRGPGKPAEFAFIEEWESAEHLDAHLQTAHVREAGAKAGPLLVAPPSIERYRQIG